MTQNSPAMQVEGEPFHIAFGIDASYFRYAGVTIVSILENNRDQSLHFHILTEDVPDTVRENFRSIAEQYSTRIDFHLPDLAIFRNLYEFSASSQYSPAIFTRLMIPATLRGIAETVLYLDADIICSGSIADLRQIDMRDQILAVVSDELETTVKNRCAALHISSGRYFNSGVMLINVANWLAADVTNQVFATLRDSQRNFLHPDQDALNLVLGDQVLYIEERWNLRYNLEIMLRKGLSREWLGPAVFMHFTGRIKPWLNWNLHPSKELFVRYQSLTPWRGAPLEEPRNYKEMRMFVRFLIPQKQFAAAFCWYSKYLVEKLRIKLGPASEKGKI